VAKVGESLIDAHNAYVVKLREYIQAELDKMCTLTEQLDRIDELLEKANCGECDTPVIITERNIDNGKI